MKRKRRGSATAPNILLLRTGGSLLADHARAADSLLPPVQAARGGGARVRRGLAALRVRKSRRALFRVAGRPPRVFLEMVRVQDEQAGELAARAAVHLEVRDRRR